MNLFSNDVKVQTPPVNKSDKIICNTKQWNAPIKEFFSLRCKMLVLNMFIKDHRKGNCVITSLPCAQLRTGLFQMGRPHVKTYQVSLDDRAGVFWEHNPGATQRHVFLSLDLHAVTQAIIRHLFLSIIVIFYHKCGHTSTSFWNGSTFCLRLPEIFYDNDYYITLLYILEMKNHDVV